MIRLSIDVYDGGKRDNVSATKAEQALRMNDTKTLKRILHPIAYKRLDSWSKILCVINNLEWISN